MEGKEDEGREGPTFKKGNGRGRRRERQGRKKGGKEERGARGPQGFVDTPSFSKS